MKLLALDSSTEHCSAAVSIDGAVRAREAHAGQTHSSVLLGMVDELLCAEGMALRDLDAIAYGEGPGSFTGLRIACGLVQGLAFGAQRPVVGVGTLLAMAEGAAAPRVVCCLDARMQEIYLAAYEREERGWRTVHAPSVCPPTAAPRLPGDGWLGCGSGFAAHRAVLCERYGAQLAALEPERYPHARDIARLGLARLRAGMVLAPEEAVPVYLREKVALRIDERAKP